MIIALATGSALSAMLLVIFHANKPKPCLLYTSPSPRDS